MRKRSWWDRRKDRKAAKTRPMTHHDLPPIDVRADQRFEFEGREFWHVAAMAADIAADPEAFALVGVSTEEVRAHVEGLGGIDVAYAETLSDLDLTRPLITISYPDGRRRVVDGYHRLHQAIARGVTVMPSWSLTAEQSARYVTIREPGGSGPP